MTRRRPGSVLSGFTGRCLAVTVTRRRGGSRRGGIGLDRHRQVTVTTTRDSMMIPTQAQADRRRGHRDSDLRHRHSAVTVP